MRNTRRGFTLIELSIVLVIIGLLVGGVLVGRDMVAASYVRAQVSQIEKLQTATNTFKGKFGYLPGDIPEPEASRFGFAARGQHNGQGDGNGMVDGVYNDAPASNGPYQQQGETCLFWVDLGAAKLLDGNFTSCTATTQVPLLSESNADLFLPAAKMGSGNHIYVYNDSRSNWFGLSAGAPGDASSKVGLTVIQAYQVDKKIDDGFPQLGMVNVMYLQSPVYIGWSGAAYNNINLSATPGSSATCFDNGNVNGAVMQYSITQNNGTGMNCALSFKFQ